MASQNKRKKHMSAIAGKMRSKHGDKHCQCKEYKNEAGKDVVEFKIVIPRGPQQQPKTAAVILNAATLENDCEERVMSQLSKTLEQFE